MVYLILGDQFFVLNVTVEAEFCNNNVINTKYTDTQSGKKEKGNALLC